ncbi:putative serine/threonine-protein kinase-like protein CCR3 [Glycine max]|nr:putative serine/threonine-protein kinase-like protein CCR3 [Glycine max]
MTPPFTLSLSLFSILAVTAVHGLGSAATTAVTYGTATVCGIVAGEPQHRIQCSRNGSRVVPLTLPNASFDAISGGRSFFCGLRSGGRSLHCWDTAATTASFRPKRVFHSDVVQLADVAVGDSQVCAREVQSGVVRCWRGSGGAQFSSPSESLRFRSITCGCGFSCGIVKESGRVVCWGDDNEGANRKGSISDEIHREFKNFTMSSLVAGVSHVCGLTLHGALVCKGNNDSGQLGYNNNNNGGVFLTTSLDHFSGLALGEDFTCGIRTRNGVVVCWGGGFDSNVVKGVSFESLVAGLDYVCGLTTRNLTVVCWGKGRFFHHVPSEVPLGVILPGPCVEGACSGSCGTYPDSGALCHGSGSICYSCQTEIPLAVPLLPPSSSTTTQAVPNQEQPSSLGAFVGLCTILYFIWICARRFLLRRKEVVVGGGNNNSVKPTSSESDAYVDIIPMPNFGSNGTTFRTFSSKSRGSRRLGRHRSGSSSKRVDRTESFSLSELATATENFSLCNKIGAGSFGSVYKGMLRDGREVAIKRGDSTSTMKKKFQEKEIAFDSELTMLSRLHHKHLVRLIGFCEENDERLLVYEYMSNGSLYDHLHDKNNVDKSSSILNSWRMRIKIALDAARGIEYIHNYAVPPIIHRDIKSSNILLDSNWNARVSDFGLSKIWHETEQELMSTTKAVGTVGYIDPEYYVLNVLTTKSDVYGLGVVMLELLTGKRAVFKPEDGSGPMGVVEYTGPKIASGELWSVLDYRVGHPEVNEVESIQIMAYTAMHCVNLEGKERPEMTDIVANLERALAFIEGTPTSLSFASFSAPLE